MVKRTSVLLVDDHTVIREGLRAVLSNQPDLEIIGEAGSGAEAIAMAKKAHPDVVLMDVAMPNLNGLDATRQILKDTPETKVLILTAYDDDECVNRLMKAGAAGYLLKHTAASELPQAIREVRRGNAFFSPSVAKHLRSRAAALARPGEESSELTARELEVLRLVAEGFSNREAAEELGISIKTIEKHRQQVMNKLNIHEVAGLTRYAIAQSVVPKAVAV